METGKSEPTIKRIGGYLNRVVPIADSTGKIMNYALKPLMVEFRPRDLMQVIVGASILAVPVAMTEETWVLGTELPLRNVLMLSGLSLLFIAGFAYTTFTGLISKVISSSTSNALRGSTCSPCWSWACC